MAEMIRMKSDGKELVDMRTKGKTICCEVWEVRP